MQATDQMFDELCAIAREIGERRMLAGPPFDAAWHRSIKKVLRAWRKRQRQSNATVQPSLARLIELSSSASSKK